MVITKAGDAMELFYEPSVRIKSQLVTKNFGTHTILSISL